MSVKPFPPAIAELVERNELDAAEVALVRRIENDQRPERFIAVLTRAKVKGTSRAELVEAMRAALVYDWHLDKIGKALAMRDPVRLIKAGLAEIGRLHA